MSLRHAWMAALIVVAAFVGLMILPALARDLTGKYAGSPLHDWYEKQHSRTKTWCCNEADGHRADQWGIKDGHFWVVIDGTHVAVPDSALVDGPNITGHAIAWTIPGSPPRVRCFMPGSLS